MSMRVTEQSRVTGTIGNNSLSFGKNHKEETIVPVSPAAPFRYSDSDLIC